MQLNSDQLALIDALTVFWFDDDRKFFVLSGQAGVGKTTCMRFFKDKLKSLDDSISICMSAPTNKAVAVLNDSVDDSSLTFKTIYSILGLRMSANGEFKELTDSGEEKITDFNLVIVDEASMVNSDLIEYIKKKTHLSDTKIIFIGDKEQLPPVKEQVSPIWTMFKLDYELTKVMRHQNCILDFVQSIRGNKSPTFVSTGDKVFIDSSEDKFSAKIEMLARKGAFHSGKAKAIAWRNVTVDAMNQLIRRSNETTNSDDLYVIGDRIVVREPIMNESDRIVASTDEEGTVVDVGIAHHTIYPMLKAWRVKVKLDWTSEVISANVIHADSTKQLQTMLDDFKEKKQWKSFWKLKEAFHNIAYGYALTSHRSQGSTFEHVFVEAGDIMMNRNIDERTKCMYVACSRASKSLHVFP